MNISALFIRRPIMTTLSMLSILLLGIIAYQMLPVSDLPNVDFPTIQVSASLPGASPDTMAAAVATPLEKEFSNISGIDSMTSSSSIGGTQITIQFALNRDIDAAAQDVQAAIARAGRKLPSNMPNPPTYRKVNPADQPILYIALTSPTQPMYVLDEFGQTTMAQRISTVSGVAQVQVFGSQKYAVRIELDPRELASRGIGIEEVAAAVGQQNVNLPLGTLNGPYNSFTLEDNGQLMQANQYMPLVVATRNGQPVRLQDIGRAIDSVENDKQAAWYWSAGLLEASRAGDATSQPTSENAAQAAEAQKLARQYPMQRAVVLAVQRQPGTNTVEVADAVKALLPQFRDQLPASVSLHLLRDGSVSIRNSADEVKFTLILTLCLVVMVIFLFLRNLSATVIPSMVLPMSIIGTFAVMYAMNYSLDNLSLMALTLSVGFVVDDAIVMLENVVRHMEMGKTRMRAALDGAKEISFTIVSMTLSLAAVFIPFLLMGGIVGRLFREFSVTIGAAVLVSGFVSLTLTPMLASRFLKDQHKIRHGWLYQASERCFQAMQRLYGWSLWGALRASWLTIAVSLAILGGTVWLFIGIPKDFIPSEDRDMFQISTEAAQDTSFDRMVEYTDALAKIVKHNENVSQFMASAGGGGAYSGGNNVGRLLVILKPRDQRTKSVDEVINELRPMLASVPGVKATPLNPPPIQLGGRMSKALYQVTFQAPNTDQLYKFGDYMEEKLSHMAGLQDINSDLKLKNRQLVLDINRDKASSLGVTPLQIEQTLSNAYSTGQISTILAPNNQYQVIMELMGKYQADPSMLERLYVRSPGGRQIPISALATMHEDVGPLQVNHTGQLPSVTISFNLKPGVVIGQAIEDIRALVEHTRLTQPAIAEDVVCTFPGTAQAFEDSMKSMGYLFIFAVIVIYIVLGILYESFYHPITILSALPFAAFGALLTLMLFNVPLSIYAYVGIIMLVGLVKKNGIMMVDFALAAQRDGKNATDAIHEACLVRFRPIMMTTVAALMAGLPIALGMGAGAESRRPLGLAVVGGLLFSQSLTLYVTPVIFVLIEHLRTFTYRLLKIQPTNEDETNEPAIVEEA